CFCADFPILALGVSLHLQTMPKPTMPTTDHRSQKKFAIIVAGGSGKRMGSAIAKQFLPLHGLPVLIHTLQAFAKAEPASELILVLPPAQLEYWKQLCARHKFKLPHTLVAGGT